jgi:hypothetical protein
LCGDDVAARKQLLKRIADHYDSPHWRALAQHYDELTRIFESEWDSRHAPKTYAFMKVIDGNTAK